MKINKFLSFVAMATLLFTTSCRNDNSVVYTPKGAYENGIFIANEGNITTPNAEISFIPNDLSQVQNNVYSANNNNAKLGDVLQSIGFSGSNAYLVLNNTNKVVITNRYTMKKQGEITQELVNPRYIALANNYIYITNDTYMGAKYLSIYKADDLSYVKKIDFGSEPAERVVEAGGKIFVQNASFGSGKNIRVINTTDNTVASKITVPNGNIQKTISYNGAVYTITSTNTDSYIYQISSTGNITQTITLTGISNATNLDIDTNKFYFTSGNKVYAMDKNATVVPDPLFTVVSNSFSTLYGFNVIDGVFFTSDANGFTANSKVSVYSASGNFVKSFTAGMGTNSFYKN